MQLRHHQEEQGEGDMLGKVRVDPDALEQYRIALAAQGDFLGLADLSHTQGQQHK